MFLFNSYCLKLSHDTKFSFKPVWNIQNVFQINQEVFSAIVRKVTQAEDVTPVCSLNLNPG